MVRDVIHRFKYEQADFFEPLMEDWLRQFPRTCLQLPDCIIPIPLHPLKKRDREFNQAESIARLLSDQLQITVDQNWPSAFGILKLKLIYPAPNALRI